MSQLSRTKTRIGQRVLSIMPNRPVRDQWEYLRKTERHFPIKSGQPINRNGPSHFPNSLIRAKNRFVKNGTAYFSWNIATEISGPPQEVVPNTPVRRNRNGPFHLKFGPKFPESLAYCNGKHPSFHWSVKVLKKSVRGNFWARMSFIGICRSIFLRYSHWSLTGQFGIMESTL